MSDLVSSNGVIIFAAIGLLAFITCIWQAFSNLSVYLRPSKIDRYLHSSADGKPAWAVVTGASAGIGKALAHELASRGFNIVLHGRNSSKIEKVIEGLKADFPARSFRALIADASRVPCKSCVDDLKSGDKRLDVDEAVRSISDLHLTVLVNNCGTATFPPQLVYGTLESFPSSWHIGIASTNALFPTLLLARLMPTLVRNAPALVLNVGSLSDNGLPLLASYSATKTFGSQITQIVAREMQMYPRDVEMLNLRVGQVTGVSHLSIKPSLFTPSSATLAKSAIARVGCGESNVIPWFPHALQQLSVQVTPRWLGERIILQVMAGLRDEELSESKAS